MECYVNASRYKENMQVRAGQSIRADPCPPSSAAH